MRKIVIVLASVAALGGVMLSGPGCEFDDSGLNTQTSPGPGGDLNTQTSPFGDGPDAGVEESGDE